MLSAGEISNFISLHRHALFEGVQLLTDEHRLGKPEVQALVFEYLCSAILLPKHDGVHESTMCLAGEDEHSWNAKDELAARNAHFIAKPVDQL